MICGNCGFEVKDGSAFCPECGAPVTEQNTAVTETKAASESPAVVSAAGTPAAQITQADAPAAETAPEPIKPRRQFIPKPGVKYGVNKGARIFGIICTLLLAPIFFVTLLSTVALLNSNSVEYTELIYATVGSVNYGFTAAEVQNFLQSGMALALFGSLSVILILGIVLSNIHQIRYAFLDLGIVFVLCGIALIFADIMPYAAFIAASVAEFVLQVLTAAPGTLKIVSFAAVALGVLCIVLFIICNAVKMREAIRFKKLGGKYKLVMVIIWLVILLAASVYVGLAASGVLALI